MEVIKCGTEIKTKIGGIKAMITAVRISFNTVEYEVSYFFNSEYKVCWLSEQEFTTNSKETETIGFKNGSH